MRASSSSSPSSSLDVDAGDAVVEEVVEDEEKCPTPLEAEDDAFAVLDVDVSVVLVGIVVGMASVGGGGSKDEAKEGLLMHIGFVLHIVRYCHYHRQSLERSHSLTPTHTTKEDFVGHELTHMIFLSQKCPPRSKRKNDAYVTSMT